MKNRVNLIKLSVYGLMVSLLLSIIFSVSVFTLENSANKLKHNEIVSKETLVLTAQNHILSHRIDDLAANLVFLRSTYIEFIIKDFPYNDLDDDWIVFANQMKCFDKIRFIDLIGNEILRIDYNESTGAYMVDSALLENKASAAYFQDAIKLDEGQIAVSSISLETSAGQVVVPNKPLLRLSTPVYAKGKLIGITVIDYLAKYILADYQSVSDVSVGNNFLLNTNGYWLYNDIDPLKSWSFTNPNKLNVNFPNEYPEVWKQIKSNKSGEIQTKSYCFIYQDMTPVNQQLVYSDVQSDNDSEWIALTMIPTKNDPFLIYRTEPISFMLHVSQTYLLVYGYIILLGFAIAFLLLIYLNDNKKIKYISERDIMTNAYNRHTGLAFLEKTYLDSTKNKKTIAISYIDINGLKEVNDNLGHNIGDELILTVAEVIKSSIRENDFMIRYGGDEFILVFTDVDNEITQRIWLRINNQLAQINESENRRYLISISYGIRITKLEEFENIDDIVKEADAQMYKHKRDTKSSLIIIR